MTGRSAFEILSELQSQFADAERQWRYEYDIITGGYKDAYNLHFGALQEMKNERLVQEQEEASKRAVYMFVFSCVSAGFAGGAVGALMSKWIDEAGKYTAEKVFREGIKGATSRTVTQLTKLIIPQSPSQSTVNPNPYVPAAGKPFDVYIDNKIELDGCFARVSSMLQKVSSLSQQDKWNGSAAEDFADSFRKNCPLMSGAPDPFHPLDKLKVAKAAELAMWVAWANIRDWDWWNPRYTQIDQGIPLTGRETYAAFELNPALARLDALGKGGLVRVRMTYNREPREGEEDDVSDVGNAVRDMDWVLDLRKLRAIRLQSMPDLPFDNMNDLDMWRLTAIDDPQSRVKFLTKISDLPPSHVSYKRL